MKNQLTLLVKPITIQDTLRAENMCCLLCAPQQTVLLQRQRQLASYNYAGVKERRGRGDEQRKELAY
jgi:hypothetical protein